MRSYLLIILMIIMTVPARAGKIINTEVYPKPAHEGEPVYFGIEFQDEASSSLQNRVEILIAGRPLTVALVNPQTAPNGNRQLLLRGTAPVDFDWRQVTIRLDEQDYPAGPDDPYMICDAPFRVKSASTTLPISVAFHDAHFDDVELQYVDVINDATGQLVNSYPIWQWIATPFQSYLFDDLTAANFNCTAGDTAWIKVVLHCDDHDWPFIPEAYTFTQHLKVRVGRDLPSLPGWYSGDIHTHSQYTNNLYEYGGPLEMYAAAAQAVGLSFVTVSDHSSDFDASGNLWGQMAIACAQSSTPQVHLFPAEEVCLDDNEINNSTDNRIHYLNYSNFFIRGPEAPITQSLDVSDQFTYLSQALALMESGGGFGYAAHPFQAYDPFQAWFGLAMMTWSGENYTIARSSSVFAGLEIMNERNRYKKDVTYWYELNPFPWQDNPNWEFENTWITQGLGQWDNFLSAGLTQNLVTPALLPQKLFVSAGSDCHGDFNYRTYNVDPIFYDVWATDNAFGHLRTAVFVPGYGPGQLPPLSEIMAAYRLGRSISTDGPFVEIGVDANGDGDLDDLEDIRLGDDGVIYTPQVGNARLQISWQSNEDWGTVQSLAIFRGDPATGSNPIPVWISGPNNYSGQQNIPLANLVSSPTAGWVYLRAEALGTPLPDGSRHAFTNPVWLRVDPTPTASVSIQPQTLPVQIPHNGGSFQYTITATNQTTAPLSCQVWIEAILPSGNVYPLLNTPVALPAGVSATRVRQQVIPASAPAGDYVFRAGIGFYPTLWSSDGFMFSKLGSRSHDEFSAFSGSNDGWIGTGEIFSEAIAASAHQLPLCDLSASPNPFNATMAIRYQLSAFSQVRLRIFDTTGRLVTTLMEAWKEAGTHQITFDGSELASGLYFYQMMVNHEIYSGKLLLLK
jgi:hypothetical protein